MHLIPFLGQERVEVIEMLLEVGRVVHCYPKVMDGPEEFYYFAGKRKERPRRRIFVAAVQLGWCLSVGDLVTIRKRNGKTNFNQVVKSMEINHKQIQCGEIDAVIGLKVKHRVRVGDIVYLNMSEANCLRANGVISTFNRLIMLFASTQIRLSV